MNNLYTTIHKITAVLLGSLLFLSSCSKKTEQAVVSELPIKGIAATGAYLTENHQGLPVLCWTEQDAVDSLYRLKYAVYDQVKNSFDSAVTVPGSTGCGTSAESMAKIAFKSDGTVIALFAKPFPKEKNPYAGAIYYSLSKDAGQNWSEPRFLHSDTSTAYGRGFFDVTRMKDGELAAIWLDGRFGKSIKGSALYFSKTEKGGGFETDTCLDKGTCECCRTNILSDQAGNLHLAYRNISYPSALSGRQVRDMVYSFSDDNGETFSAAKPISEDNWEIEGCPHSGPTMTVIGTTVQAVWFTAGGTAGLYGTSVAAPGGAFQRRQLISASGRHPQAIALSDGKSAMVCEETAATDAVGKEASTHGHQHGSAMEHGGIVLSILNNGNIEKKIAVTEGQYPDHHAVLQLLGDGLLLAWTREGHAGSRIYYTNLKLAE